MLRLVEQRARAHGGAAHLRVVRDGRVLLDRAFGCPPDSPFLIFSAGKPLLGTLVHQLADRGQLDLDDTVATYWPAFGQHGKDHITIRHVLQHRAGLPVARGVLCDALLAPSWPLSIRALETARPATRPGDTPAYHILSFGFLLGEVVQRVTKRPLRDVLRSELLDPLGMRDTHLGTPPASWPRRIPVRSESGLRGLVARTYFNRRAVREAVIPAASVTSTATDLSRFYQMLLDGGGDVLSPAAVAAALTPSSDMEIDGLLGVPVRWAHGFQLGGSAPGPAVPRPMGRLNSRAAFGHNGSNTCLAWADPDRRLIVVYLTNVLHTELDGSPHQSDVSDAVIAAFAS